MLLTVNINNSNISIGAFKDDILLFKTTLSSETKKTCDEYAASIKSLLSLHSCFVDEISGVIIACVVPSLAATIKNAFSYFYDGKIFIVGPGLKTGLKIPTENPTEVGANFVCQAVAILDKYPAPCLLVSMGTALSIFAIDKNGCFIGGSILPGINLSAKALAHYTAQIPQVDLSQNVSSIIGSTTLQSVRAGLLYGTACTIDGMSTLFQSTLGDNLTYIATGDFPQQVLDICKTPLIYEENLTFEGLRLIYNRNKK